MKASRGADNRFKSKACSRARSQPRSVQAAPPSDFTLQMPEFGTAHGRIELDQNIASPNVLTVADVNCAHHAALDQGERGFGGKLLSQ